MNYFGFLNKTKEGWDQDNVKFPGCPVSSHRENERWIIYKDDKKIGVESKRPTLKVLKKHYHDYIENNSEYKPPPLFSSGKVNTNQVRFPGIKPLGISPSELHKDKKES